MKLGDFIENGTGVCRHKALALQLALQEAGISSRLVYGDIEITYESDGKVYAPASRHAWVAVADQDGNESIFDPEQKIYGRTQLPFQDSKVALANDQRARILTVRGSENFRYRYKPDGYGGTEGVAALDKEILKKFALTFVRPK